MSEFGPIIKDWEFEIENPEAPATDEQKELFVRRCIELSDPNPGNAERERTFGARVFPSEDFDGTKFWIDIDNIDAMIENPDPSGLRRARIFMNVPEVIDDEFYRQTYLEYAVEYQQLEGDGLNWIDVEGDESFFAESSSIYRWADNKHVPLPGGYSTKAQVDRAFAALEMNDALGIDPSLFTQQRFVEAMRLLDFAEALKTYGGNYEIAIPEGGFKPVNTQQSLEQLDESPIGRLTQLVKEKSAPYPPESGYPGCKEVAYEGLDKNGNGASISLITFDFTRPIHPSFEYAEQEDLKYEILFSTDFSDDDPLTRRTKFMMRTYKVFEIEGTLRIVKKTELCDFEDRAYIMQAMRGEITDEEFWTAVARDREKFAEEQEDESNVEDLVTQTQAQQVEEEEIEDLINFLQIAEYHP